jgi:hypothetical protein
MVFVVVSTIYKNNLIARSAKREKEERITKSKRVKEKRVTQESSEPQKLQQQQHNNSKTEAVVTVIGRIVVAATRGTAIPRIVDPRAAE